MGKNAIGWVNVGPTFGYTAIQYLFPVINISVCLFLPYTV